MALMVLKVVFASLLIAFASWFSGKRPDLAGFIIALPLTTLLALAFSQVEYKDPANSVAFARSIMVGIPVSLLFFVPFLFAERFSIGFWQCYALGIALLAAGYFLHRFIVGLL